MTVSTNFAAFGRVLIAVLYLIAGFGKIAHPAGTQAYIASVGLPLPLLGYLIAVVFEVGGGILLLVGYQARIVSLAVAVFTLVAGALFHNHFADQNQLIHFLKNVAIIGGLLQITAYGAGAFSFDSRRLKLAQSPA
jgi:putative oxidoreductase